MEIIEITKEKLNSFLCRKDHSQFLRSWEWGEFQKRVGFKVFCFGIEDEGKLLAVFTLIKKSLGLGKSYFYCPGLEIACLEVGRGGNQKLEIIKFFIEEVSRLAQKEACIFLRFEAGEEFSISNFQFPISKTIDIQPRKTIILDMSRAEEEILNSFHQKTRYNIRLAEKKGVVVRECRGKEDFENWWKIMEETCHRDGFRLHGREYYWKMVDLNNQGTRNNNQKISNIRYPISNNLSIKLLLAEYNGKIIAGNIVSFFGDTATYVHGASANEYRNVMATYFLQWEAIGQAKALGCRYYDMYGIDEKKWPGVTRFKRGFGGSEVEYQGTFDAVFSPAWYNGYRLLRRMRRFV